MTAAAGPRVATDPGPSLNRTRIFAACGILLAVEIAIFLFLAAGTHGLVVPMAKPTSTDFVSFYAAGSLADAGTPQLAYDPAAHYAAEQQATQPGITYNYFFYPPVFLLLCTVLARLPYMIAFMFFEAATLLLYLLVARQILTYHSRGSDHPVAAATQAGMENLPSAGAGKNSIKLNIKSFCAGLSRVSTPLFPAFKNMDAHGSSPWAKGPRDKLTAARFSSRPKVSVFRMTAHATPDTPCPDLIRASTSVWRSRLPRRKAWKAGSSPAEGILSCFAALSQNPISGAGQPWHKPGQDERSAPISSPPQPKNFAGADLRLPGNHHPASSGSVLAERGWGVLLPLLAFPPVLWTIGLGQNALLTAALFGAATLLVDRRPIVAGLVFGALCYKPHFGLLVPVALVAGRRWPALAAASFSVAALSLLSLVRFGPQTWHAYLSAMTASRAVYETGHISFAGYVTPFGAMMLRGAGLAIAYSAQIAASIAAAAFVAFVWRRGLPLPIRAATLAAATLAAVPLALFYDLMIAAIAALWLLRADGAYRLPDWGKVALAVLFVLTLDPRGLAQAWHLPVGPLAALGMTALVATLALRPALGAPVVIAPGAITEPSVRPTSNRLPARP